MGKLFEPIKIGTMELKNRIVMPPMGTNFASEEGFVTGRLVNHHVERAKGGVGLTIPLLNHWNPTGFRLRSFLSIDTGNSQGIACRGNPRCYGRLC